MRLYALILECGISRRTIGAPDIDDRAGGSYGDLVRGYYAK